MSTVRKGRIFLFLLVIISAPSFADQYSAQSILAEIKANGAKAVVKKYYSDNEEQTEFLTKITDGGPLWVKVATELLRVTDAAYSSNTEEALGWHLWRKPEEVLPYIESYELPQRVCSPALYEGQSATPYYLAMEAAIIRLQAVSNKSMYKAKSLCLEILNRMDSNWESQLKYY